MKHISNTERDLMSHQMSMLEKGRARELHKYYILPYNLLKENNDTNFDPYFLP